MFEGSVYLDTWIFNNQYTAKDKLSYYHYVHMQSYGVWRYIDVYIEIKESFTLMISLQAFLILYILKKFCGFMGIKTRKEIFDFQY